MIVITASLEDRPLVERLGLDRWAKAEGGRVFRIECRPDGVWVDRYLDPMQLDPVRPDRASSERVRVAEHAEAFFAMLAEKYGPTP